MANGRKKFLKKQLSPLEKEWGPLPEKEPKEFEPVEMEPLTEAESLGITESYPELIKKGALGKTPEERAKYLRLASVLKELEAEKPRTGRDIVAALAHMGETVGKGLKETYGGLPATPTKKFELPSAVARRQAIEKAAKLREEATKLEPQTFTPWQQHKLEQEPVKESLKAKKAAYDDLVQKSKDLTAIKEAASRWAIGDYDGAIARLSEKGLVEEALGKVKQKIKGATRKVLGLDKPSPKNRQEEILNNPRYK